MAKKGDLTTNPRLLRSFSVLSGVISVTSVGFRSEPPRWEEKKKSSRIQG